MRIRFGFPVAADFVIGTEVGGASVNKSFVVIAESVAPGIGSGVFSSEVDEGGGEVSFP